MEITKLTADVAQISKLGDYPKPDNGLTTEELKAWFDKAPAAIKEYLNDTLVPELEAKFDSVDKWAESADKRIDSFESGSGFLPTKGGTMTGPINMGSKKISDLATPTLSNDAATKNYVDTANGNTKTYADTAAAAAEKNAKDYCERKKLTFTSIAVSTSAFASDSTYTDYPYRAAVALEGVTASMIPEVVFPVSALANNDFAPVAECYNGGVYIYAEGVPSAAITIPTIICWR